MELSKARFVKLDYQILTMDISPSAKIIYAYLANGARGSPDKQTVSVPIKKLASDLKLSRETTKRTLKVLIENDLISIVHRGGKINTYKVHRPGSNRADYPAQNEPTPGSNRADTRLNMSRPYTLYKKNIKRDIKRDGDNTFSPPSPSYDERIFREKAAGDIKYIPRKED